MEFSCSYKISAEGEIMGDLEYALNKLGYHWFELDEKLDLAELIINIIRSKNLRFIKAIPFIIYQSKKNAQAILDWDKLGRLSAKAHLEREIIILIYLSRRIFQKEKLLDLAEDLEKYLEQNLTSKERKILTKNPNANLKKLNFKLSDFNSFLEETYREFLTSLKLEKLEKQEYLQEEISRSKELDLKFSLSFLFQKKQREIIQKILQEQVLTKTEYEYYIRIIKKRLEALIRLKELAEAVLRKRAKRRQ